MGELQQSRISNQANILRYDLIVKGNHLSSVFRVEQEWLYREIYGRCVDGKLMPGDIESQFC